MNYGVSRAVRVPFSTAVPQLAVLDIENCIFCGKCEKACPADAIDFTQIAENFEIKATSIVMATGFEITPRDAKKEYGAGKLHNVIDGLFMERLLAPTGPYGRILRPGDGKEPDSIAYVQCAGSRDETLGVEYCSRVCCMYAIKQSMLISGSLPLADISIYYMDIRAFGKGYEQFFQNARAMGVEFIKAKVASITEDEDQNPVLRVELMEEESRVEERTYDMVVLSVGLVPAYDPNPVYKVPVSDDGFIEIPTMNLDPCVTARPGIFVTGTAAGPMDIVDSIVMAGAAAAESAAYIEAKKNGHGTPETITEGREPVHA
jgi:heterodisulfide reductase subunit A